MLNIENHNHLMSHFETYKINKVDFGKDNIFGNSNKNIGNKNKR